jgi:outer membrane beta-barrel protein
MKTMKGLTVMQTSWITNFVTSAVFLGALALSLSSNAQGEGRGPAAAPRTPTASSPKTSPSGQLPQAPATGEEKVDVSDLEKKYWSTKDTDFNVVQNRLYSKANRFLLSANFGTLINDPWSTGQVYAGSAAYFLTEHLGVELLFDYANTQDNSATRGLIAKTAYPDFNRVTQFIGLNAVWAPFYAKMSVLTSTIIYFDMSISLGVGMQAYVQQRDDGNQTRQAPAAELDVTQHFYLNKHFAVRVDLKNRWYTNEVVYYRSTSAATTGNRVVSNNVDNTTLILAGLTFMF